ncbi:hypothetical protein MHN79_13985 [Vibrio sp. Of14-4]|uniref:hypothetical protein n=1 Tax=Vibrio sp. Of14-4 TaxID=2724878 RepID=UPI001EF20570|nr:hypothetical protein [Vibrio sp. Of14-4]MCG7490597.1 hypothetical protein [Vibrio sp. Of14-4]
MLLTCAVLCSCDYKFTGLGLHSEEGANDAYREWFTNSQGKTISVMESPRHWKFSRSYNKPIVAQGKLSQSTYNCFVNARPNSNRKANMDKEWYMTFDENLYIEMVATRSGKLTKVSLIKGTKTASESLHLPCDIHIDELFTQ